MFNEGGGSKSKRRRTAAAASAAEAADQVSDSEGVVEAFSTPQKQCHQSKQQRSESSLGPAPPPQKVGKFSRTSLDQMESLILKATQFMNSAASDSSIMSMTMKITIEIVEKIGTKLTAENKDQAAAFTEDRTRVEKVFQELELAHRNLPVIGELLRCMQDTASSSEALKGAIAAARTLLGHAAVAPLADTLLLKKACKEALESKAFHPFWNSTIASGGALFGKDPEVTTQAQKRMIVDVLSDYLRENDTVSTCTDVRSKALASLEVGYSRDSDSEY